MTKIGYNNLIIKQSEQPESQIDEYSDLINGTMRLSLELQVRDS